MQLCGQGVFIGINSFFKAKQAQAGLCIPFPTSFCPYITILPFFTTP